MMYEERKESLWDKAIERLWQLFCWFMIYGAVFTLPLWAWFVGMIHKRNVERRYVHLYTV